MSLADDLNTGGVVDAMAARFAAADAALAAELDRLIKAGKGNVEPPRRGREVVMQKCSACGKQGHNARSCEKRSKARPEKVAGGLRDDEAVMPARISVQVTDPQSVRRALMGNGPTIQVATLGVEKLLELVAEAKKELARRRDEARILASKLETALEELGQ